MIEIANLIGKSDSGLSSWGAVSASFTLDNGMVQLATQFTNIKQYHYQNALEVTEVDPLVDYLLSEWARQILEKRLDQFREFMAREMEAYGGVLHITKDSGLFVSSRS
ncbi:MAG: hypothetical protein ABSA01_05760 [Anaerolineales bacterium]